MEGRKEGGREDSRPDIVRRTYETAGMDGQTEGISLPLRGIESCTNGAF